MPTVTINIAGRGTPLATGGASAVGHMWYELNGGQGASPESFGFAPDAQHHGDPFAPGQVYETDSSNYQGRDYSRTIEISQSEYEALKNFGKNPESFGFDKQYNGLDNSCIDFTWKALGVAGLNSSRYEGSLWPTHNIDDLRKFVDLSRVEMERIDDLLKTLLPLSWPSTAYVDPLITSLQTQFNHAQQTLSPLVLDLDGKNGAETISQTAGVHFDHDKNKFAEQTGWVGKNDGLLVWDRNGNGQIDNGAELFGNNTILKDGSKAANGFAALDELDSNHDHVVDAQDQDTSSLRVFRDANSNGVVDAGELLTLAHAGVKSLNTGYTMQAVTDASGNQHLQAGSFTTTAGQTRAMDDVWFAVDTARTVDTDLVAVNSTIAALPELAGFGNVYRPQSEAANELQWSLAA